MILLNRYLLKQFFQYFCTVSIGFVAIYLLVDFFDKIDKFSDHNASMGLALKFFLLNIPFILDQLGPVLILLAGVITFGLLSNNNELRALKAGGIPQLRILKPLFIGALVITVIFLMMAQWLLPRTIATTNKIWYEQLQGKVPLGILREGRYYYRGEEGFYSFEWPDTSSYSFRNFSYSRWSKEYHLALLLSAKQGDWTEKGWTFSKGQLQTLKGKGDYGYSLFETQQLDLPETPDRFFVPEYKSSEMSITDLFLDARQKKSKEEIAMGWTYFFSRISYILLGLPLLLLGIPVLNLSFQKWGRDLAIAIPASCLIAFVAWGAWGALQALAKAGYMPPLIAASVIHLLFAAGGISLLLHQDR